MSKYVEFFFDVGSPASYLAWTQLPILCTESDAELRLRPILLGGLFQATGNSSPVAVPAKGKYIFVDFARYAERYGVPLHRNPHFPINTLTLMRAITGAQMHAPEKLHSLVDAVLKAIWVEPLNMSDPSIAATALEKAGFAPELISNWSSDPDVKARLKEATEDAAQRGVFGAPTMFVKDAMFFGQDRLDWVRDALK